MVFFSEVHRGLPVLPLHRPSHRDVMKTFFYENFNGQGSWKKFRKNYYPKVTENLYVGG
jgi:hypothetical protein